MAAATSSPELFINSIGTFITKSDLGVGTIVGAAVFNVLCVPACCGIFAKQVNKSVLVQFQYRHVKQTFKLVSL